MSIGALAGAERNGTGALGKRPGRRLPDEPHGGLRKRPGIMEIVDIMQIVIPENMDKFG